MIPEKLPQKLSSASSKVSLKQAKRDQEASHATDSTTYKNQLSQVSLKVSNERVSGKLQQANTKLD